jgi:hypothetical protein
MEQVLLNLAVNARDAMPNGGKLTIETANFTQDPESIQELAGLAPGLYVKLSISDTGVGMDKEVKSHLFEPFFTTKGPGKGTGLGLATCFGIVKGSGGEIRVHSKAGQGSTFEVYLPRVEGEADQVAGPGDSGELPRGMETVLLAEDDPSVRFLTAEVLRRQGYAVLEAEDGEKTAGRPRARQGRYSPAVDRRGHAPDGRHRAKQAAANYAPRDQGAFHFKIRRRRRRAKWWIGC